MAIYDSIEFYESANLLHELLVVDSDRAFVMASVARIDHMLFDCLISKIEENDIRDIKRMGLSKKIDAALENKLIDSELHEILHAIRKIRNDFAHDFRIRDLNNEFMIEQFGNLLLDPYMEYAEKFAESTSIFMYFIKEPKNSLSYVFRWVVTLIMENFYHKLKYSVSTPVSAIPDRWKLSDIGLTHDAEAPAQPRRLTVSSQTQNMGIDGFLSSSFIYSERRLFFRA